MDYYINHFTKHQLLHAPHKWFLALLSSPIHFLEMRYKTRYHLNYENAKKLFVFDLALLASIIVLIGLTIFWFTYNPTVSDYLYLTIKPSDDRIASGDYTTYTIDYKNQSKVKIINTMLSLELPNTFITNKIEPVNLYSPTTQSFNLAELKRNEGGEITISGWFYGVPDQTYNVISRLTYQQQDRKVDEEKIAALTQIPRGSVLKINLTNTSTQILAQGSSQFMFSITNQGNQTLHNISLPLQQANSQLFLSPTELTQGKNENNIWQIGDLAPQQTVNFTGNLISNITNNLTSETLYLIPTITINNQNLPQTTLKQSFKIIKPKINFTASWQEDNPQTKPGKIKILNLKLTNQGTINPTDLILELPLSPDVVDLKELNNLNQGIVKNNYLIINKSFQAGLSSLASSQTTDLSIQIPIKSKTSGGTDLTLTLTPRLHASIPGIDNGFYENTASTQPLKIGTTLDMTAELRYYTNEGDQLGRGPLPPQIGQETKYWGIINITNGTSQLTNLNFSAELPSYIKWTGKNSVSIDKPPTFDSSNNKVHWSIPTLNAHETAGLYFEISFTPNENQRGTWPIILQNITVNAHDTYLDENLSATSPNLDTSLKNDSIGQKKGTLVQ